MSDNASIAAPIHFVIPGPINTVTGGFIYDRKIVALSRRNRRLGVIACLDGSFPDPDPAALDRAVRQLDGIPADGPIIIDGLALSALAAQPEIALLLPRVIALVHHPLADETGLSQRNAERLYQNECAALGRTSGIIATSATTARRLLDFGQSPDRIETVRPGLDLPCRPAPRCIRPDATPHLLCVGSLIYRKGQDVLLAALAKLSEFAWHLDLVGGERDPAFAERLRCRVRRAGLADRVTFHGEIDAAALARFYADADLFVLASRHEGFGMALSEAMGHGIPVLSCLAGAIPETVPGDAGILVPPDDERALASALHRLLIDPALQRACSVAARQAAERFGSWEETGRRFLAATDRLHATA